MKVRLTFAATLLALVLLSTAACATAEAAKRKPVKGIDVSRFQGRISWNQVGKTEIRFAYLAASRGYGKDCTVVPEECVYDRGATSHAVNLFDIGQKYADVVPTSELMAGLAKLA